MLLPLHVQDKAGAVVRISLMAHATSRLGCRLFKPETTHRGLRQHGFERRGADI